ncbi:MAG TPA: ActD-like protein, partial [Myxococcales bacterium]|nr:ActD-like protein [Myxococcales bacterium]
MTARPPVPDWWLERLAAGDLPPARAEEIRARLAAEPGGEERLAALARSNQDLLDRFPAAEAARRIRAQVDREERAERPAPRPAMRWMLAAPMAAALAVALLVIRLPSGPSSNHDSPEITRAKGPTAVALRIHRQTGHGIERLASGAGAHPRDRLQLSYASGGARHGVLLS